MDSFFDNTINNTVEFEYEGKKAVLRPMLIENQVDGRPFAKRPAILVLPGGGYGFTSDREAEPVARYFNANGFHCFVLRYSVNDGQGCFPAPFYQAAKAMEYIRNNSDRFNVDEKRLSVIGFSAGGHLAAWLSNGCDSPLAKELGINETLSRPNAQVLCYPVITSGEYANVGSFVNLCGCEQYRDEQRFGVLSCEKMVTKKSPPAFIWQTVDDDIVPSENSVIMAKALKKAGVHFELHMYESGPHGLSVCDETTEMVSKECAGWKELCVDFLKRM